MDVVGVKVLSGFLFFFIAFSFGCIPFFLFRRCFSANSKFSNTDQSRLVPCLHALASGVLIATCLLHLLPESLENVQNAMATSRRIAAQQETQERNISESSSGNVLQVSEVDSEISSVRLYPVAELLVAMGFLVIFMIDSVIKSLQNNRNQRIVSNGIRYSRLKDLNDDDENEIYVKDINILKCEESRERKVTFPRDIKLDAVPEKGVHSEDVIPFGYRTEGYVRSECNMPVSGASRFGRDDELIAQQQKRSGHVRSAALVMALCIHGFFDGIMLGLQTSASVLYSLLLALSLHKSFVATSLSLTLLKNYSPMTSPLRIIGYVLLFASVAPVGLVTSAAFVHSNLFTPEGEDDVSLVPGCIQAFAVGTFLYVTFTETTGRLGESSTLRMEILCHLFLLTGFLFMAVMRLTFSDS